MMVWHYDCPKCSRPVDVDWEQHGIELACPHCRHVHYPPTPSEDHSAYIGGNRWPPEIEEAVIALRGTSCNIPGCYHQYETLGQRKAFTLGGRISVENLLPMCNFHARLKGDQDYDRWVRALPPEQRAGPAPEFEIVFTDDKDDAKKAPAGPARSEPSAPAQRTGVHPLHGHVQIQESPLPDLRLVTARPVPAGTWSRLVLAYSCKLKHPGPCRVIIAAWPCGKPPDWSQGLEKCGVLHVVAVHSDEGSGCQDNRLELDLSRVTGTGLWTVVVLLGNSGGRPELTDYLLYGQE